MMAVLGIVTFAAVYGAASCKGTTTQLYNLNYGLSVISLVAIGMGFILIHMRISLSCLRSVLCCTASVLAL